MKYFSHYTKIPEVFWSSETGDRFQKCSDCSTDLLAQGTNYLIQKAWQQEEVICEYALCLNCVNTLRETLSLKSKQLVENFYNEHVNFEQRMIDLIENCDVNTESWIDHCIITQKHRSKCSAYQIYGWFIDHDIVFTGMPYMISGDAVEAIMNLLSNETLGSLDDFAGRILGLDLPKGVIPL